jgi:hypothetical protein
LNDDRYQRGKKSAKPCSASARRAHRKNRTPFNAEFQDFLMEYAWGGIWDRPASTTRPAA